MRGGSLRRQTVPDSLCSRFSPTASRLPRTSAPVTAEADPDAAEVLLQVSLQATCSPGLFFLRSQILCCPLCFWYQLSIIMGSIGNFAEEFWNVEVGNFGGWEIVSQRMKEASKVTANYVELLKQVATAMDTFGRALLKSSKNPLHPNMEHGELKASLDTARMGVELWGQDNVEAAAALTAQVGQLTNHITQAKDTRRLTEEEVKQRQQHVREAVRRVRQAQHVAQIRVRELTDAESLKLMVDTKPDTKTKEREKAAQAEERAVKANREAENVHKDAVSSHNAALDSWCTSARNAFKNMQFMEEKRVTLLRESMWNVANICSLLAVNIDQHQESTRTALLQLDVSKEISTWVAANRTLQTPPIPLVYTPSCRSPHSTPLATPSTSARSTLADVSESSNSSCESSPVPLHKAKALYQFSARSESEVSLLEGQVITVMDVSNAEWSLVRTNCGALGFVPAKFISAVPTEK